MFNQSLFGSRLRELRQNKNLSIQQVAAALNVHRGTLNNLEIGKRSPSIEVAIALADYFSISLDYLVGRSNNPERND